MKNFFLALLVALVAACSNKNLPSTSAKRTSGNPLFEGWYADPEGVILDNQYWIYPTYSAKYEKQVFLDAFSSNDLVTWEKHPRIVDTSQIKWARMAMWAPAIVKKDNRCFLFFSANDIQSKQRNGQADDTLGGIGIAVADNPGGPFKDYLGQPLINKFYNNAQPIDQYVFRDKDGQYYIFYGGWGRCNVGKLNEDFTGLVPFSDGLLVKEITPKGYVEGPTMFIRNGKYYFMWSEGGWTNGSYKVAYAVSDNVFGPFERKATILEADEKIATGAGHHSVINLPGTDQWYIVYHRRPIPNLDRDHRVTCIDELHFDSAGNILPVKMTFDGVSPVKLKGK